MRSNIIAFDADQIQESKLTTRYVDKLAVVINLAAMHEDLAKILIQKHQAYFTCFFIGLSLLIYT